MAKVSKAKRITKKSDIPSKISSPLDKNSKTKTDGETRDSPKISSHSKLKPPVSTKTKPRAKKVQQNATKSSKTSKESLKEIEATIRSKCISAIQRRTALEQRLREAYEKTDLCKRDKEIEDIKIDLCALVDELFNDELLRKWIPVSVGSI
ncbi:unnamed protein product [Heterobilharzia americana]|nr:unnamed protein product [Heterobilharzia americana]